VGVFILAAETQMRETFSLLQQHAEFTASTAIVSHKQLASWAAPGFYELGAARGQGGGHGGKRKLLLTKEN